MKALILLGFVLVGCSTSSYKKVTSQVAENGLQFYETDADKCYVYRDSDGSSISCFRKDSK